MSPSIRVKLATSERQARLPSAPLRSHPARLALLVLSRSLGESPRFAPNKEQVRACLEGAADLIREHGYWPEELGCDAKGLGSNVPGCGPLVRYSLIGALGAVSTTTAHVHAARYLSAWLGVLSLSAARVWTRGEALRVLGAASRAIGGRRSGGWRVTSPASHPPGAA